jgi:hypothetical protein
MNKIDLNQIAKTVRFQDVKETVNVLSHNKSIFWSWGVRDFRNYENKIMRFTVSGHHHKGHVYIAVNGNDLYDVYITSNQGNIKDIYNDIYFDDLVKIIDNRIEKIKDYSF